MGSTGQDVACAGPAFNVLFVGAGGIVFGNGWVPWNHSAHLERILGRRLRVVGIVDPSRERFDWVLDQKRASIAAQCYSMTAHYASVQEAAEGRKAAGEDAKTGPIQLIMLASPPQFRGTTQPGRDLEAQLLAAFGPGPAIFAEKPVTTASAEEAHAVARNLEESGNLVGVGYMLRYLKVVQKAAQIIRDNNLVIMSVNARYAMAYAQSRKIDWWDKEKQGGPVVEQATHFCDLCRFFGGEIMLDTVRATCLRHDEPAGKLSHFSSAIDESKIPEENRVPRVTSAFWKYASGAVGTLSHIIALHGITYANEIDVAADGYQLRLVDLYKEPRLFVRYPDDEKEVEYYYPGDDPFYNELAAICSSQDEKSNNVTTVPKAELNDTLSRAKAQGEARLEDDGLLPGRIQSSFEDATKTYEFSWRIRLESEKRD